MLYDFLKNNKDEVLHMTEGKSLKLAGLRPSSTQLKAGLPIFYQQLIDVLEVEKATSPDALADDEAMVRAASDNDEEALTESSTRPAESIVAKSAGVHGSELMRLGYTLSHVVHAYGAMCQSITELATMKHEKITADEFHDLNRCLDIAIAGAVTEFQHHTNTKERKREIEHLGFLAHELRNTLMSATVSFQMIKKGSVGYSGSTGKVLEESLKRMQTLINESLTEVRMQVDPKVSTEEIDLRLLIDQIFVTAEVEAAAKFQVLDIQVPAGLSVQGDNQLIFSAISNLIQNAIKYTRERGRIQVRADGSGDDVSIEVEDECGGLSGATVDLFKPFEQQNPDRSGLGLGLTIAQKAIFLNKGKITVTNLPGKGCIFKISLPKSI